MRLFALFLLVFSILFVAVFQFWRRASRATLEKLPPVLWRWLWWFDLKWQQTGRPPIRIVSAHDPIYQHLPQADRDRFPPFIN